MKARLIKDEEGYSLFFKVQGSTSKNFIASTSGMYLDNKLSKQNCDEIFGVVDVEKYVDEYAAEWEYNERIGFRDGFNKAMELNKDKLFNEDQMRMAYGRQFDCSIGEFIQSLQQPTEIEVEIEMECIQCQEWGYVSECRKDCNKKFLQPKLDSEGCLILKKI